MGKISRLAERRPLNATVQFRKGNVRTNVQILDISTHGVRIAAIQALRIGDTCWIRLPQLEPQQAKVVWVDEFVVGCQFARPLHPSVLDNILRLRQPASRKPE
ncbi:MULTISPECIES: PilZ domain-containing protein [Stenotrophomonas]|uniref:PilZ domain-containing protein n=1 Tax=Stenotrophomonas bentonitica TaxID=1450134 RepID=A0ABU9JQN4_9GAMM|nr:MULTISPECIES: PilZ domain-containing protein [Stenotrophomonas]MBP7656454.1 PilZ domain-containing protein [Pseudoxanthomonas sp.]MCA0393625.1 PilZ domain-containing protein [Pseudomonadota bacterium]CRR42926.1 PilZ domain protein [Pseudomonas aeruginosa]MBA0448420.1 PilZ domain-containing protein [Stenotrophomonas maltophilia]MDG9910703.1 PilZ domain-containing protein [Stenotrophomonas maltophilia]